MIYLIGSMRNAYVPTLANILREEGYEVFDDWHAPGPRTDEHWQDYEKCRGRTYQAALDSPHAWNVFRFDKLHLDKADAVVLVLPAGKSAHMELGYSVGMGKRTFVLFPEEPERFDIMYRFATQVCMSKEELIAELQK